MNSAAGVVRALWHLLLLAGMLCTAGTASTALAGALPVGPIKTHLLSAAQPAFDIQDGVHALMETGPSAGIAAIADGARGAFLPHPAGTIYALSERNTLWIHLRLERAPNAPADWTLHIPLPYLDHAVLYQVNPKGQWESQVSGDMTPVSQWTRPGLYPEFQLNNFSGGPQDVYLQIRNYKSLGIPLRLASAAARDSQREVEYVAIGLLLGSLAMLLAFLHSHDRHHLALLEERRAIEHLALHDALTGLPNRFLMLGHLEQAIRLASRHDMKVAVLFLDLDGFKPINDRYGHPVGDIVLKEIARRLQACVRDCDTAARYGGDEFVVLLTEIYGEENAALVAEKLLDSISQPIQTGSETVKVSASIGIAIFPNDGDTIEVLINLADKAMYVAKQNSPGLFAFSDPQTAS
jgi:diguanylate cyclase (GGDEF)-like protein